ncbi:hypothetical protein FOA52_006003 [Chlamydomonas sp. UWO 241]|nr:hypothetical protein FOA52_006003 [Chlamydomonas sp. UWO 241]
MLATRSSALGVGSTRVRVCQTQRRMMACKAATPEPKSTPQPKPTEPVKKPDADETHKEDVHKGALKPGTILSLEELKALGNRARPKGQASSGAKVIPLDSGEGGLDM